MATVFMDPDSIYPARDSADKKIDGDRRSIEELSGASPTLTVELGSFSADNRLCLVRCGECRES